MTRFTGRLRAVIASAAALLASAAANAQLSQTNVEDIVRRAVDAANTLGINATIAVVDREGNLLACVRMVDTVSLDGTGVPRTIPLTAVVRGGGFGGLDTQPVDIDYSPGNPLFVANNGGARVATSLTAISKAGTGAFLSTAGNAFTTRTAAFIVQSNFPPMMPLQPSGPLYGVQFSQLPNSDFNRLTLGLSADSGGLPLYINGQCVGGIGVECNDTRTALTGTYGVDTIRAAGQVSTEERIALAAQGIGAAGFAPPAFIQASMIFVGGLRLPYTYAAAPLVAAIPAGNSAAFIAAEDAANRLEILFPLRAAQPSMYTTVPLTDPAGGPEVLYNGVRGQTVSGFETGNVLNTLAGAANDPDGGGVIVGQNLTAVDVQRALFNAHATNSRLRAMIRRDRPLISQVNVSVVDIDGNLLGYYRSPDAPVFGMDVSLQKARSALFFSRGTTTTRTSASTILTTVESDHLFDANGAPAPNIYSKYATAAALFGLNLDGTVAFGERTIGFLARNNVPDGIPMTNRDQATPRGPFGAFGPQAAGPNPNTTSVFNTGIQTDVLVTNLARFLLTYGPGGGVNEVARLADFVNNRGGTRPLLNAPFGAGFAATVPGRVSRGPAVNVGEIDEPPPMGFPDRTLANGMQIFPGGVPLYKLDATTNTGILVGAIGISGDGIEQDDNVAFAGAGGFVPGGIGDFQRFGTNIRRADRVILSNIRFLRLPYVKFPRAPYSGL